MTDLAPKENRFADKCRIDEDAYFLEVTGDSMLPVYRMGDVIMVSPKAKVSQGDRVVVRMVSGEVVARVIHSEKIPVVELAHLDPSKPLELRGLSEIDSISKIIWATQ